VCIEIFLIKGDIQLKESLVFCISDISVIRKLFPVFISSSTHLSTFCSTKELSVIDSSACEKSNNLPGLFITSLKGVDARMEKKFFALIEPSLLPSFVTDVLFV